MMIRKSVVGVFLLLLTTPLLADKKLEDRMLHTASILQEIRGPLDEEAPGALDNAYAVAIFPQFVKVGLLGGVKHGRGVLATRLADGRWSRPAFVRLTSGSVGLQVGVSVSQLLVVFKSPRAVQAISGGQMTIGADAGYAAGDLGGSAGANTDSRLRNPVVALARSQGLFAGVALEGGVLRIEKDANVAFYNDAIGLDGRTLLDNTEVEVPPVAQHFLIVLNDSVPPLEGSEPPVTSAQAGSDESGAREGLDGPDYATGSDDATQAGLANTPARETQATATPAPAPAQGVADAAPVTGERPASMWVTPEGQTAPAEDTPQDTRERGDSRVAREISSRARKALWSGAKSLVRNELDKDREVQATKVAVDVGKELVVPAVPDRNPARPARPAPRKPTVPSGEPARMGEWVEMNEPDYATVAAAPDYAAVAEPDYAAVAAAPDSLQGLSGTPYESVERSIGSAVESGFNGPPAPSEWPQEWLQEQALTGACEQGS